MAWQVLISLAWLAVLTTWAARSDIFHRRLPTRVVWIALGFMAAALSFGIWPWSRLWWAVGTWAVYDGSATLFPGTLGYGDVKWAAVTMAFLGPVGLVVLGFGHVGTIIWGTVRWAEAERPRAISWAQSTGPWLPGAAVGVAAVAWLMVSRTI